uniref:Uncharacterized protein n=1 Tax=Avena sativa TaxID=4498 RepID=A0ACD5YG31_AVESA
MKEHIKRLEDRNNREGYGNIGLEEENLQSNNNVVSRSPILPGKIKRVQCDGPIEARSSMQHDTSEDNNLSLSHEKDGEHDNVNQLLIQQKSSSALGPVIDSVPEVTVTTNQLDGSSTRLNRHGTRSKRPQSAPSKRRRTSSLKDGSRVVLKTSTYPNKRNIAYATIRSTNPATKAGGIELGAEFALVRIDESIIQNEELVREVGDCKTIGDAFSEGFLIAWPWAFIRKKDD